MPRPLRKVRRIPATAKHAKALGPHLSEADRNEVAANSGRDPQDALLFGVRHSRYRYTYTLNGKPFAIAGFADDGDGAARVWMLVSDDIKQAAFGFCRRLRADLEAHFERYDRLHNIVHAQNTTHIRLLKWLGFSFGETVSLNGHDFIEFWRERDV